jgi:hypothetical protein
MNSWFTSSTGSNDLSLTIKGLLLALVPLSVTVFRYYGYEVAQEEILEIANALLALVSAFAIAFGLVRKIANRFM